MNVSCSRGQCLDTAPKPFDTAHSRLLRRRTSGSDMATLNINTPTGGLTLNLDFPFASFTNIANVNLNNPTSIKIAVNPNEEGAAGDLQLLPINTYGTPDAEMQCVDGIANDNAGLIDCDDPDCLTDVDACPVPAPAMSAGMLALLVSVLGAGGLFGIKRMHFGVE